MSSELASPVKVYVLTKGTYSDYHICGIFSTKENAETQLKKWIDLVRLSGNNYYGYLYIDLNKRENISALTEYEEPQLEEWELDKLKDDENLDELFNDRIPVKCYYAVIILETGEFFNVIDRDNIFGAMLVYPNQRVISQGKGKVKIERKKYDTWYCYSAISEEHAQKVCIEKRQEYLRSKIS